MPWRPRGSRQRVSRFLADDQTKVLGHEGLDVDRQEPARSGHLRAPAADDVHLDAAAGEPAEVVERSRQVPGEAVEVVDDDRPGAGRLHPLGQPIEAPRAASTPLTRGVETSSLRRSVGAARRDSFGIVLEHGAAHSVSLALRTGASRYCIGRASAVTRKLTPRPRRNGFRYRRRIRTVLSFPWIVCTRMVRTCPSSDARISLN